MTTTQAHLARQPILERSEELMGYELLFRPTRRNAVRVSDNRVATATVLSEVLNTFGVRGLVGEHDAFINVDRDFLMDDVIERIPRERFILEILETLTVDSELVERIRSLRQKGYGFAVGDLNFDPEMIKKFRPILEYADIVKVDILAIEGGLNTLKEKLPRLRGFSGKLLAEKVETREDFARCKALGFEYFQGYFFARPVIMEGKKLDPERLGVMKLTTLLQSDAQQSEIIKELERHPDLGINLLKYINSSSYSLRQEISSISQAINMLGRLPLAQWLTLFVYSNSLQERSGVSLLINTILLRAELMKRLCKRYKQDKNLYDKAYLCGMLSLIDTVFQVPKEEIFNDLSFGSEIEDALIKKEGFLGKLLIIAKVIERGDFNQIERLTKKIKMPISDLYAILSASYAAIAPLEEAD